jgi:two-component system response regulator HydG
MSRILLIDDDKDICTLLSSFLEKKGYEVETAGSGAQAIKLVKESAFALALCDYKLPDTTGLELLQRIKVLQPSMAVIIITGYSDVRTAVQTLKYGASDYVTKPLYPDEILLTIKEALSKQKENVSQRGIGKQKKQEFGFIVGKSPQSETVQKYIDLIAPADMSVIITGETGTGKEFVAKAIHRQSPRADRPFVAIDCGALPRELAGSELFGHIKGAFTGAIGDKKGSFEMANTGTLFLDEIGNLTYENQVKLLRVLQERKIKRIGSTQDIDIDVRIIVATNEDLVLAVKEGKFREDLYHRINEFKIELVPLRERRADVVHFANHFLAKANEALNKQVQSFSPDVSDKLMQYHWHGNLRELNNVVKRAVLLCNQSEIGLSHLPPEIISPEPIPGVNGGAMMSDTNLLKSVSGMAEREAILEVLHKTSFNKTKAAAMLNIDRKTLYNKLKAFGIKL